MRNYYTKKEAMAKAAKVFEKVGHKVSKGWIQKVLSARSDDRQAAKFFDYAVCGSVPQRDGTTVPRFVFARDTFPERCLRVYEVSPPSPRGIDLPLEVEITRVVV